MTSMRRHARGRESASRAAAASEPMIDEAAVAPGHDGQAVLVVRVRYPNGALDTVTLAAGPARKLLDDCAARGVTELRGQPWQRLLHVLEPETKERKCSRS